MKYISIVNKLLVTFDICFEMNILSFFAVCIIRVYYFELLLFYNYYIYIIYIYYIIRRKPKEAEKNRVPFGTLGLFNKKVDMFLENEIKEKNDTARVQFIILQYRINYKTSMIQQPYISPQ